MCVCVVKTTVLPDNFSSYPPDNHHIAQTMSTGGEGELSQRKRPRKTRWNVGSEDTKSSSLSQEDVVMPE